MFRENSYKEESLVKWHHVDLRKEIRPYAFMNLAQEIAGMHANALHFGYYDLLAINQVWVLSRIRVRFLQYPKWGDQIWLETWHKGMQSLFGLRDFVLHAPDGSDAVLATSSWLIMNVQTRKIERNNAFNMSPEIQKQVNHANALEEPCERLRSQPDMELIREHTVKYSDIDYLLHTNNAKYAEWITDSIDQEIIQNYRVKEFQINFNSEAKLGETIQIYRKETETPEKQKTENQLEAGCRTFYFEGRRNGVIVFESQFTFIPATGE